MTATVPVTGAVIFLVLLCLFCMTVGAALALEYVIRRWQPRADPAPAPMRVQLGRPCGCACCCGRTADTLPFPAATFYMSEWQAELAAAHRRAEQTIRELVVSGEMAIPHT